MALVTEIAAQLETGGIVMIPILATGLVMWWLIIAKFMLLVRFRRLERKPQNFTENPPPQWHWQCQLASRYKTLCCGTEHIDIALVETLSGSALEQMGKGIMAIALLASAAPLMGLLGTVTGMITTFDTIAEFGTGNVRGLAGGISQALVTTQGGLLVAIPGFIAASMLKRRITRLGQRMTFFLSYMAAQCHPAHSHANEGALQTTEPLSGQGEQHV